MTSWLYSKRFRRLLQGLLLAGLFAALIAALSFGLNYKHPDGRLESYGLAGSVAGRLFTARQAAGFFPVGGDGRLRFNLENFSKETFRLRIRCERKSCDVPGEIKLAPGLTKVTLKNLRGPAYLLFDWDRKPSSGIVLTLLPTREYKFFRRALLFCGLLALILLMVTLKGAGGVLSRKHFVYFTLLFFIFFFLVLERSIIHLTGDEPHYMVQAESIAHDFDLDLRNNYDKAYYYTYYPGWLNPQAFTRADGRFIFAHYILPSLLTLPAFVDRIFGLQLNHFLVAKLLICFFFANLCAGLVFVFFRRPEPAPETTRERALPVLISGSFIFTLPFLSYQNQLYPETLAAGCILPLALTFLGGARSHISKINLVIVLAGIVLLPLAHIKFSLPAVWAGLIVLLFYYRRKNRPYLKGVFAVLVLGTFLHVCWNFYAYDRLLGNNYLTQVAYFEDLPERVWVYFFDVDRGLFGLAPILLLAIPGWCIGYRGDKLQALLFLALILSFNLPNLIHELYLLGSCPIGRYWIAPLPVIILLANIGLRDLFQRMRSHKGLRFAGSVFLVLSLFLSLSGGAAYLYFQESVFIKTDSPVLIAANFWRAVLGLDVSFLFSPVVYVFLCGFCLFLLPGAGKQRLSKRIFPN